MRIINKYNNRCLYDTKESTNITVSDLKRYILEYIPFQVLDAKTKEDVTRTYLMQIVLELEGADNPLFTEASLENMIRFYGDPQQKWIQRYLEQSLNMLVQQQKKFQGSPNKTNQSDFLNTFTEMTEQNLSEWQKLWGTTPKTAK